jgi:hypothetical membrane protein
MRFSYLKLSGTLYFVSITWLMFAIMAAEFTYPGYSVSQNAISDLGATCRASGCIVLQPSSSIFNYSIIVTGLLVVLGTYFLFKALHPKILSLLLAVAGICAAGVGIFPETAGPIHGLLASVVFLTMGLGAISAFRLVPTPLNIISIIMGALTLVFALLYRGHDFLSFGPGGTERFVVYPVLFWVLAFAGHLITRVET